MIYLLRWIWNWIRRMRVMPCHWWRLIWWQSMTNSTSIHQWRRNRAWWSVISGFIWIGRHCWEGRWREHYFLRTRINNGLNSSHWNSLHINYIINQSASRLYISLYYEFIISWSFISKILLQSEFILNVFQALIIK